MSNLTGNHSTGSQQQPINPNQSGGMMTNFVNPVPTTNMYSSSNQNMGGGSNMISTSTNSIPLQTNTGISQGFSGVTGTVIPNTGYSSGTGVTGGTSSFYTGTTSTLSFKGIAGCKKCGGSGFKLSKKKNDKQKPCKLCMESLGYCPKCNNTGLKIKDGKPCKCKEKKDKKHKVKK